MKLPISKEAVKNKKIKKEIWDELREMDELLQPIYLYMEASIAEKLHVDIANYVLDRVSTQIQKSYTQGFNEAVEILDVVFLMMEKNKDVDVNVLRQKLIDLKKK